MKALASSGCGGAFGRGGGGAGGLFSSLFCSQGAGGGGGGVNTVLFCCQGAATGMFCFQGAVTFMLLSVSEATLAALWLWCPGTAAQSLALLAMEATVSLINVAHWGV